LIEATFDPDILHAGVRRDTAQVEIEGQGHILKFTVTGRKELLFRLKKFPFQRKKFLFRLWKQSVDRKTKSMLGKPVTMQCAKMQAVTTLCQFQCGVVEVCAVPSAVAVAISLCLSGRCDLK